MNPPVAWTAIVTDVAERWKVGRARGAQAGDGMAAMGAALVTGASYGVGAATALALARAGYDVAVTATRLENLASTVKALQGCGGRVLPAVLDLCSEADIARVSKDVFAAFGGIGVLVNNAGANLRKLAVDVTAAEWDAVMSVNIRGTFFLSQAVGRALIADGRSGSIVNIASTHALAGTAERSTYGISKAALLGMTRMLAVEWAEHGIRVNAVAPGRLATPSPSRAEKGADEAYMAAMLKRIPLHRQATVEEVAAAVVYLASPAAASITGQVLVLDGGLRAA
jgi:NAD(P)-dependent dehydrogenase (short-subunit alcohol dehydrogenase family)